MANTPEPCINCAYCYSDPMVKDDPGYSAECKLGLPMKTPCRYYIHWEDLSQDKSWEEPEGFEKENENE